MPVAAIPAAVKIGATALGAASSVVSLHKNLGGDKADPKADPKADATSKVIDDGVKNSASTIVTK